LTNENEPVADESSYRKPLPLITPLTEPFWQGTRERRLLVQRCRECERRWWTPQYACPECLSESYEWTECSGRGTLYSYSVVHRPVDPSAWSESELPYVVAVVELAEGPHMLTNVVGCEPSELRVGLPVAVSFERATDEITLYKFAPAAARDG